MSEPREIKIHPSWSAVLKDEFEKPYFGEIRQFLRRELQLGKTIYPPGRLIFNAFNSTPFDEVHTVILGQDPYHGPRQAMGLCFSVPEGVRIPPSLQNIYQEINNTVGGGIPGHGDLSNWAAQGVFLLNAMLTVEAGRAGSHRNIGWQNFTDAVIRELSERKDGLIFLLWGNFAKSKKALIDQMRHHVLEAVHPSPLAGGGFAGCGHFAKANELLLKQGKQPINWNNL